MLSRLSRTLLRVFPAILLVLVGLIAALFRRHRVTGEDITVGALAPSRQAIPPVRRRGAAIAILALVLEIGLILTAIDGDDPSYGSFHGVRPGMAMASHR